MRCGLELAALAPHLGLTIRVGVHTGEIEPVDGDVHGLAVHEAARVLGAAGPGEVLVSEITRAVTAAEFSFADRGVHDLKGIGPRHLYAVAPAGQPAG